MGEIRQPTGTRRLAEDLRRYGGDVEDIVEEGWEDDDDPTEPTEGNDFSTQVADQAIDLVRPDLVDRVVKSLLADADRGEGQLKRSDINRAYLRKRLSIAECIEVERRLVGSSCIIVEDDESVQLESGDPELPGVRRKVRYLTHVEERELGRRIALAAQLPEDTSQLDTDYVRRVLRDADKARGTFVASNLRYVEMLARRRGERRYITTEDLKQEGIIGLLRAVDLYNPDLGFRFKTYATWWIEQSMDRAIADLNRIVRLPVYLQEKLTKIRRARSRLTFVNGRPPTESELAESLGIEPERLMKLLWRVQATEVAEGDSVIAEDLTLLSLVPDQGASQFDLLSQRELEDRFEELLSTLSPREERILRMRFGVGLDRDYTLESIGQQYSITRERIRQIEEKALSKLQHPSKKRRLRGFLET